MKAFTPIPTTRITDDMSRFLLCEKSSAASKTILMPTEAIIPNSIMDTPPMTGRGILFITAVNLPMKLRQMAMRAATLMMAGS